MARSPRRRSATAVTVGVEQTATVSPGVELCYQTFGDPAGEPLLLVMGLGGPMNWWNADLCRMLAESGFHVIRYDNRDTGRSSRMTGTVDRAALIKAFLGARVPTPYGLEDLAADAFGLLDHLGIESAHLCGVSMGGMIVQTMAISRPGRVRSLVSIMSSTGAKRVGWQDPRIVPAMLAARSNTREAYLERSVRMGALIGSPAYPEPVEANRARAAETWERGVSPEGVVRQMLAVVTQRDRTRRLRELRIPAAVIHGMEDRMVHPSGGRATARAIPGAPLLLIPGMGHDLPVELHPTFRDVIRTAAERSSRS